MQIIGRLLSQTQVMSISMTSRLAKRTLLKLETGSKAISIECEILSWTFALFHVHIYIEPETLLCVPPFA